ncbi:MAG: hypothetical protein V3S69_06105 [Dehalococcoidales bacterium]
MKTLPDSDEMIVENGVLTEQTRLYLLQLGQLLNGNISLIMAEYDDLTALDEAIPNPDERQLGGIVTGQGLAINKSGTWVLASDDTTAIT